MSKCHYTLKTHHSFWFTFLNPILSRYYNALNPFATGNIHLCGWLLQQRKFITLNVVPKKKFFQISLLLVVVSESLTNDYIDVSRLFWKGWGYQAAIFRCRGSEAGNVRSLQVKKYINSTFFKNILAKHEYGYLHFNIYYSKLIVDNRTNQWKALL